VTRRAAGSVFMFLARSRLLWCLLLCVAANTSAWAQAERVAERVADEYQVKAAYLYKFLGFVEWPPQVFETAQSPFVIGVIGADALADELALVVASRQVNGRPAVARKLRAGEPITGVHVLFIGRDIGARAASVLAAAKDLATLTVTESEEAFAAGSVINFVVVESKVRFDVALRSADASSLKISSRLLGVARRVRGLVS
jgi:hypothetical protein